MSKEYTKEFIIEELKIICEMLGRPPKKMEFVELSDSKWAYTKLFDNSFNQLKKEAGIPVERQRHKRKYVNKETILSSIKEVAAKNPGKTISWVVRHSGFGEATVRKYLGNIEALASKIDDIEHPKKPDKWELIADLKKAAVEHMSVTSVWALVKDYCNASNYAYATNVGDTKKLYEIVNKARQQAIVQKMLEKRYPVKYKPAPIILKWMKKRAYWLKNA